MSIEETKKNPYDEDFNLIQFIQVIWQGKSLILFISITFAILSAIFSLQINNYYSSQALLIPAVEESSMNSNISNLASFAGLNLGEGSNDKTKEALAVLNSRKFIVDFIEKYNLNMPILASKRWDPGTKELVMDESVLGGKEVIWKKDEKLYESYRKFVSEHYSVSSDILGSGLITVRVNFISPYLSKQWVDLIVKEVNSYFKEKEIGEANKSLIYLNSEVKQPNLNLDLKKVLYGLIQEQTSILVIANGKDEYMFRTIDPAYVSDKKAGPLRSVYVILAFLAGMMVTIFSLFIAFYNDVKIQLVAKFPVIKITKI